MRLFLFGFGWYRFVGERDREIKGARATVDAFIGTSKLEVSFACLPAVPITVSAVRVMAARLSRHTVFSAESIASLALVHGDLSRIV